MSANLVSLYVQQFSTNLMLLLQQKGSKFRGWSMSGSHVGNQASPVDQIGPIEANPVTGRFQPIARTDATVNRRWVFPQDYDTAQMIDEFDKLRLIIDPQSAEVQNAVYALGRRIDDEYMKGIFGTNQTGINGTTPVSFATGQIVAVNAEAASNTSLTVAKIRAAKKLLMANFVDLDTDPLQCFIAAAQHDSLLRESQIIDRDYNMDQSGRPVLAGDGMIHKFLGVNFIHCERITTAPNAVDGSGYQQVPFYARSGVYLGIWGDIFTDVSRIYTLSGLPWQCYAKMTCGVTRIEEKRVVNIKCNG